MQPARSIRNPTPVLPPAVDPPPVLAEEADELLEELGGGRLLEELMDELDKLLDEMEALEELEANELLEELLDELDDLLEDNELLEELLDELVELLEELDEDELLLALRTRIELKVPLSLFVVTPISSLPPVTSTSNVCVHTVLAPARANTSTLVNTF